MDQNMLSPVAWKQVIVVQVLRKSQVFAFKSRIKSRVIYQVEVKTGEFKSNFKVIAQAFSALCPN